MDRAGALVILWAREAGALGEIEVQVQPAGRGVELGPGHLPGLRKAKSSLEQVVDLRHQRSSSIGIGSWRTDPTAYRRRLYPQDSARSLTNLIYFNEVDRGGHFAAWEEPELFSTELRAASRPLREGERRTDERRN